VIGDPKMQETARAFCGTAFLLIQNAAIEYRGLF
jgi:hypothetical protein